MFDWHISNVDDESELEESEKTAAVLERTFGISLENTGERMGEQFDEPPDDWYDQERLESHDADDSEIISMFGGMFE
jgi:hypothetical protein